MEPKIKTVSVQYHIKVNGLLVDAKPKLGEARKEVKKIPLTNAIKEVSIIKVTTTEQILDVYEPKQTTILTASQLDEGLDEA